MRVITQAQLKVWHTALLSSPIAIAKIIIWVFLLQASKALPRPPKRLSPPALLMIAPSQTMLTKPMRWPKAHKSEPNASANQILKSNSHIRPCCQRIGFTPCFFISISRSIDDPENERETRRKLKEERLRKKERKKNKKARMEKECIAERMNCFSHDSNHWKTAPLWNDQPFCFCMNANNNTYTCIRTINQTHNYLYCEFTTGLITYYNLRIGKIPTHCSLLRLISRNELKFTIFSLVFAAQIHLKRRIEPICCLPMRNPTCMTHCSIWRHAKDGIVRCVGMAKRPVIKSAGTKDRIRRNSTHWVSCLLRFDELQWFHDMNE